MPLYLTLKERREFCALKGITLDGKRAVISGIGDRYATITAADTGINFKWSWESVKYIVSFKKGHFISGSIKMVRK